MNISPSVVSVRRNFVGVCGCNRFQKIIPVVFRFFEFSHSQDQAVILLAVVTRQIRPIFSANPKPDQQEGNRDYRHAG